MKSWPALAIPMLTLVFATGYSVGRHADGAAPELGALPGTFTTVEALPAWHPPVPGYRALPPGHPPLLPSDPTPQPQGRRALPEGHPPIPDGAFDCPAFGSPEEDSGTNRNIIVAHPQEPIRT